MLDLQLQYGGDGGVRRTIPQSQVNRFRSPVSMESEVYTESLVVWAPRRHYAQRRKVEVRRPHLQPDQAPPVNGKDVIVHCGKLLRSH